MSAPAARSTLTAPPLPAGAPGIAAPGTVGDRAARSPRPPAPDPAAAPRRPAVPGAAARVAPDRVADLSHRVLWSMPRRDQRRSGELYVRGLLRATGRKTIRNIASHTGVPADIQRLHHLVSASTWRWSPVRGALAHHMGELLNPVAWVLHTATTPRAGPGGVGVDAHCADPRTGRPVNARRSVGLWAATEWGGYPVDWHLGLSARWAEDTVLRERAGIPEDVRVLDAAAAGVDLAVASARTAGPPCRPVVLDARTAEAGPLATRLGAGGVPYLLRVSASQLLTPLAPDGPQRGPVVSARQLAGAVPPRRWSRVCVWGPGAGPREVARVACRAAGVPSRSRQRQTLLVQRDPRGPADGGYWLTDLGHLSDGALLRLAAAPARLARDMGVTGRQVGLYDFEGRTFAGWHRHMTLASVAHATVVLLRARGRSEPRPRAVEGAGTRPRRQP
ncbi:transposase [Streptomyces europaeiscabiei]|uniref:IS701 family transposase n=1 Tax=Streptomyces europaeiscabiei TaxID=146819 RepID=UPI0029B6C334|nr:transposase [Streptomyces europaeiscabiei]MDX3716371.1 transposase [Streptomyces europaeiscabiei]